MGEVVGEEVAVLHAGEPDGSSGQDEQDLSVSGYPQDSILVAGNEKRGIRKETITAAAQNSRPGIAAG